jgi:hypothetical protein
MQHSCGSDLKRLLSSRGKHRAQGIYEGISAGVRIVRAMLLS